MFRTDLLSIIRSLNTVFTSIGICHTGYVDCLLARSGWNWIVNTVLRLLMMDSKSVKNMMKHLLTAIGLSPGGSSTVHIYTQTIHRTIQNKQYIEQHNNFGRVQAVPRLG